MNFDTDYIYTDNDVNISGDYNFSDEDEYVISVCDQESSMHFESIFIPVLYSLVLVVGLVGNVLVLVVLWKKRLSLNVTDIFILHLSLADVLLLLTFPLWAAEAVNGWSFGTGLCKLAGALFRISFYCGVFMLTCISIDRYLSIVHALEMFPSKKVVHCCCVAVWLFCLLLSIPDWMFLQAMEDSRRNKIECVHLLPSESEWHLASRVLYHVVGFAVPVIMLLFCYTCIRLRLQRGSQCMQKGAMRVIIALVLAFVISWTAYNITLIIDTIHTRYYDFDHQTSCGSLTALDIARTATSTLIYLHCCLIPVLYTFMG